MSLVIPQAPKELSSFLLRLFNDISIEPERLRKALQTLRKMGHSNEGLRTVLSQYPAFDIVPKALSTDDFNLLHALTAGEARPLWYGRLRLFTYAFDVAIKKEKITSNHTLKTPVVSALDSIARLFFDTLRAFNEYKEGKWNFACVIDRNEVTPVNAKDSGLFWHRDRQYDNGEGYAQYTLLLLLSDHTLWKGAELSLQLGGEKVKDEWVKSSHPVIHLLPRLNQAIIFRNIDSAHAVEPLTPLQGTVQRDVFILNVNYMG